MRYLDYNRLHQILQNSLTKEEYQTILEKLPLTIISHDDSHSLKYFNKKGYDTLREIAGITEDKDTNIKDLEETKKVLDSYSQIKNPRGNKTLFTAKSLRLYSDSDV